ncbi:MAG: hypothetical protein ACYCPU_06985 [Thermoplasmata archaeon]
MSGPGIWESSYPAALSVLCCGPVGSTPNAILIVSPNFELYLSPLVLVTVSMATLLFAMNVGSVVALLSRPGASRQAIGSTALGAAAGTMVYCPTCGVILLANVLAGTAAAGLFVAWAAYETWFLLASMPLAVLALFWIGYQLARARTPATSCTTRASGA